MQELILSLMILSCDSTRSRDHYKTESSPSHGAVPAHAPNRIDRPEPGCPLPRASSRCLVVEEGASGIGSRTVNAKSLRARDRRSRAARKYKPTKVELLLVAEAPPAALDRYFYFEDVREQDALFRYVAKAILKAAPTRGNKPELLALLRERGVFLIDLKQDPIDGSPLTEQIPGLLARVRQLAPEKIILIKATVYDHAFSPLLDAGQPVVDERVPFPGSGQQRRFEEVFARALRRQPARRPG